MNLNLIKKIFPLTWKFRGSLKDFIIVLVIYLAGGAVASCVLFPLAGIIAPYAIAGAVTSLYLHFNIIKDDEPVVEAKEESKKD